MGNAQSTTEEPSVAQMGIDRSKLSVEQVAMLDQHEAAQKQTQILSDMQKSMGSFTPQGIPISNLEKELTPILDKLEALNKEPDIIDHATPVVDAIDELKQVIADAVSAIKLPDMKPNITVAAPKVSVDAPEVNVDLTKLEKLLKSIPASLDSAIAKIPVPEQPDNTDFLSKLDTMVEWLQSIDTASRMKPLPGTMKVTNPDGTAIGPVDTTGLSTSAKQDTGNTALASIKANTDKLVTPFINAAYDYIAFSTTSTTDVRAYKSGGSGGTTVATVTITYSDSTKTTVSNIART